MLIQQLVRRGSAGVMEVSYLPQSLVAVVGVRVRSELTDVGARNARKKWMLEEKRWLG
jgi:hypothetical protein